MNTKNNIFIDIITSFKGTAQLKQAESAFDKLTGTVKSFAAAYTVEKIVSDSIAAFKAESSAINGLNVALQNTGTSFDQLSPVLEKQADNMVNLGFKTSDTYDALAKLTTSTRNPAKALQVLGAAADLARYHNASLGDTATIISKVLAGNGKALADLGLKYDKTLTPINALDKLMKQSKDRVGGLAKAYVNTLGGALDVAAAKADKAKAKLGEALAPGITKLTNFAVTYLAPVFNFLSSHVEEVTAMAAAILAVAAAIKIAGIQAKIAAGEMALNPLFAIATVGAFAVSRIVKSKSFTPTSKENPSAGVDLQHMGVTPGGTSKQVAAIKTISDAKVAAKKKELTAEQVLAAYLAKADKQALADQKALNAEKAKQAILDNAQKLINQQKAAFDVQQAEVYAALQNDKLTANEKLRLQMLQTEDQLAAAIQDKNIPLVEQLTGKLQQQTDQFAKMQGLNPYSAMTIGADAATQALLKLIQAQKDYNAALAAHPLVLPGNNGNTTPSGINAKTGADLVSAVKSGTLTSDQASAIAESRGLSPTVINLTLDGQQLQQVIVGNTASGSPSTYARNLGSALRDSW